MKSIICELCGSSEFTRDSDNLFVCDYCRTKYSAEQAKSMMVEGVVRLDRSADIEPLLKIARDSVSSGNYEEGSLYSNKILEIDSEHAEAYFIKGVSLGRLSTLGRLRLDEMDLAFKRAIEHGDSEGCSYAGKVPSERWLIGASLLNTAVDEVSRAELSRSMWEDFFSVAVPAYEQVCLSYNEFKELDDRESCLNVLDATIQFVDTIIQVGESRNKMPAGNWGPGDWGPSWLSSDQLTFWNDQRANAVALIKEIDPERAIKDKSCFIATASLGSDNHFILDTLREFRDLILSRSRVGSDFIVWYYRWGAVAAFYVRRSLVLKIASFGLIVLPAYCLAFALLAPQRLLKACAARFPAPSSLLDYTRSH